MSDLANGYPDGFKRDALARLRGERLSAVARDIGVHRNVLRRWAEQALNPKPKRWFSRLSPEAEAALVADLRNGLSVMKAAAIHRIPEKTVRDDIIPRYGIERRRFGGKLTLTQEAELVALYRQTGSMRKAMATFGVGIDCARGIVNKYGAKYAKGEGPGYPGPPRKPVTAAELEDAITVYRAHPSLKHTAQVTRISLKRLKVALMAAGVVTEASLRRASVAKPAPARVLPMVRQRTTAMIDIPTVPMWRCLDCGARVSDATTCPNGHAAPWAVAA
jgi:transposase